MKVDSVLEELRNVGVEVSRRDLVKYAAIGSLSVSAAGLLAACGSDDDEPAEPAVSSGSTASPDEPTSVAEAATAAPDDSTAEPAAEESPAPAGETGQQGGVWRMALHGDPSMNVVQAPGALVDILVYKTMYNNLVKYQLSGDSIEIVPDLAESWEANEDLSEYTFVLKQGVTWHDGEPFTAEDVKFNIDTVLNPENSAAGRANLASIESVEVVDEQTVRFILTAPFAALPVMLGYNRPIFPKHRLEGADFNNPADFLRDPVGTGPFKYVELVQGSHLELAAYEDYHEGRPLLDGIFFRVIPDGNTRVAQLLSGDVDFAVIEPAQLDGVQGNDDIEVRFAPQVNYYFFAFNHDFPFFQDVRVRQALAHALDRQAIIDGILKGAGQLATGPINPLLGDFYNPNVTTYDYDMERAAQLLEEAGWTKGSDGILVNSEGEKFAIRLNCPSTYPIMVQVVTYAQGQYQELGIDLALDVVDWPVHLEKYRAPDYELLMEWWITPPDPDLFAHYHTESENDWQYSNPDVDDLIVRARSEPDLDARIALYQELQEVIADDLPVIYLYYPQEVQAMRRTHGLVEMGYRDALTWMKDVWVDQ